VDSIRQVDVDLNFLLVECSSVDWIYVGKFFWVGRIHWLPTHVIVGWAANVIVGWAAAHPTITLGGQSML